MRAVDASANAPFVTPTGENSVSAAPTVRDASTVLLVADRPDLHVLMLERTHRAVFSPGATVFPGGAVDAEDRAPRAAHRIAGLGDEEASAEHALAAGGLAFRIAAVRECFEEAGILLARDANGTPAEHDGTLAAARVLMNGGELAFTDLLETRGLVIDARELRVFSHWLTPIGAPRRYNTWFFVAPAPDGEDGTHDDGELVASGWIRPADALDRHDVGAIELIFPTEMSLRALARYDSAGPLLADLDAVPRDAHGSLHIVGQGNGERVVLPADRAPSPAVWTNPLPDIHYRAERESALREA
jgi:8-oxo-dGTP pyrophosphatase MutT (NUDIX family)